MSLISEALKKAEDRRKGMEEKIFLPLPPHSPRKRNKTLWYSLAGFVVIIVLVPFLIVLLKNNAISERKTPVERRMAVSKQEKVASSVLPASIPEAGVNKVNTTAAPPVKASSGEGKGVGLVPVTEQSLQMARQKHFLQKLQPQSEEKRQEYYAKDKRSITPGEEQSEDRNEEKPRVIIKLEGNTRDCNSLMSEGNFQEAEECFKEQIQKGETRELLTSLGICELKLKKWKEAEKAFEKALKMNSTSSLLWFNYGISLFRQKDYEKAENAFSLALRMDPPICEAYYYIGLCRDLKGDEQGALRNYKLSLACVLPSDIRRWVVQRIALLIKNSSP